jgi:hypothetical protein
MAPILGCSSSPGKRSKLNYEPANLNGSVAPVTAAQVRQGQSQLIAEHGDPRSHPMLIRFSCLMIALTAFVPGAFATLTQAAQIVA